MSTLLYDADCGFCRLMLSYGSRFLRPGVEARPLQEFVSQDPRLQPDQLRIAIKLVSSDGSVSSGAEAIARAARGVTWLYYLPGICWLADRGYAWVARHRRSMPGGCESGSCSLS